MIKDLILLACFLLVLSEMKASEPVNKKCLDCLEVNITFSRLKEFIKTMDKGQKDVLTIRKKDSETIEFIFYKTK